MFCKVMAGGIHGINSFLAQVEVDATQAMPGFDMVGLLGSEVREARERVRVALKNSGFQLPPRRITVNISPADIRKEGSAYDLPIAIGVLVALEKLADEVLKDTLFIGELGLNGEIKPVKGILPIMLMAKEEGIKRCILPKENATEGAVVEEVKVIGVSDFLETLGYLMKATEHADQMIAPACLDMAALFKEEEGKETADFADIRGQEMVKRAAVIAAAGFHHLLITGVPGAGKTMIAKRIPSILPPLSLEESLEVSKIYSVSGLLREGRPLITRRPFLHPHHTISRQALAGGGRIPRPGILSLSHRGILFLDELPEFGRDNIEVLRQPLEDKEVQIARNYGSITYPADIMLVAAMNPCPCGFYPNRQRCKCTEMDIRKYRSRISGPIYDRIDICVEAKAVELGELQKEGNGLSSSRLKEQVMKARRIQEERYKNSPYFFNADLETKDISTYCALGEEEKKFMEQVFYSLKLSARAYHRTLKVARTIADLEESERICKEHLTEAVCYRGFEI
ncbi:MAG: YifB family Mg chelatase-like AAA ATPase [Lachnospiraceae bacterium]|nr:YifB family Mg chelatase-like AAA ATPase [Lachnospiraceae bacterium]